MHMLKLLFRIFKDEYKKKSLDSLARSFARKIFLLYHDRYRPNGERDINPSTGADIDEYGAG